MRQITRTATLVGSVFMLGALAACAPQQTYPSQYPSGGYTSGGYQSNAPVYSNNAMGTEYGRVANIEVLQGRSQGQTTGAGAVQPGDRVRGHREGRGRLRVHGQGVWGEG